MIKDTPLIEQHRTLGGKIVEFAGYNMPLQYSGVLDEHKTVREAAGLFDVSHMGQIFFEGPRALAAVHRLVPNNVEGLTDGQVLYTPICYPDGGIVDDCLVYRMSEDRVLVVVNAANIDKDYSWFVEQTGEMCRVVNASDDYALIALQGPRACEIFAAVATEDVTDMPSFTWRTVDAKGVSCIASRTGYTGEDGFEIACAPNEAPHLWTMLMEAGTPHGIKPAGLGARDTLRLEARLPLYGNDIDQTTTPLEAGLGWTVKLKAGDFIGRDALLKQKKEGLTRKLVCMEMKSRGIARHGHPICQPTDDGGIGQEVGAVTSGTKSPTLGVSIAMGYVPKEMATPGTRLVVDVRGKAVEAEVIKGPFYVRPMAR